MSEAVRSLFASIARRYDVANNAISFGLHRGWKRRLVDTGSGAGSAPTIDGGQRPPLPIRPGARVLDCATGTGDVAFEALRRVLPRGEVVGVDFTPEMIELARAKIARLDDGWLNVAGEAEIAAQAIRFDVGDILSMPYPNNDFDAATIAFGIRNVDDPALGLTEMARVVKPGGLVLILETGLPPNPVWRALYGIYQSTALWIIGGLLSGNVAAYRYLAGTTRRFPSGEAFLELMRATDAFAAIKATPLLGGVAWIYRGVVR
jgi:demethylmenaquinone methyltransferase/2-methoxy-6-polyprenyl-1,4-benzoquinol methylase